MIDFWIGLCNGDVSFLPMPLVSSIMADVTRTRINSTNVANFGKETEYTFQSFAKFELHPIYF